MNYHATEKYTLRRDGGFYIIADSRKDIFYFNRSTVEPYFPIKISVNLNGFNDPYLNYAFKRLSFEGASVCEKSVYVKLLFKRLLKKYDFKNLEICSTLLNSEGRFSTHAYKHYVDTFREIDDRKHALVKRCTPYSSLCNVPVFNYFTSIFHELVQDTSYNPVSRIEFEKQLITSELGEVYVEFYSENNSFFTLEVYQYPWEVDPLSSIYIMLNEGQPVLFFYT